MKPILTLIFLFIIKLSLAQTPVDRSIVLHTDIPEETQTRLLNALDTLLIHINTNKVSANEINPDGAALSKSILSDLKGIQAKDKVAEYYKPRLINLYPVKNNRYIISIAYASISDGKPDLKLIYNFMAIANGSEIKFSIPLHYLTANWKVTKVGNITYRYPDEINMSRAKLFDKKNTQMAEKLGLRPEQFEFYLCNNHQEIWRLLGYEYDSRYAGSVSDGYGVDEHVIFSIMHNEDFSHDNFHYYSGQIRKNPRNSAADEGVAYSWGNAYYTDEKSEILTAGRLVPILKQYLKEHPQTSLLELFTKSPPVLPYTTKIRSLLASLICDEVERRGGIPAVKELLNCGRGDDNFFRVTDKYANINAGNFNGKVAVLIANYK